VHREIRLVGMMSVESNVSRVVVAMSCQNALYEYNESTLEHRTMFVLAGSKSSRVNSVHLDDYFSSSTSVIHINHTMSLGNFPFTFLHLLSLICSISHSPDSGDGRYPALLDAPSFLCRFL
jgi:hypothetical protein